MARDDSVADAARREGPRLGLAPEADRAADAAKDDRERGLSVHRATADFPGEPGDRGNGREWHERAVLLAHEAALVLVAREVGDERAVRRKQPEHGHLLRIGQAARALDPAHRRRDRGAGMHVDRRAKPPVGNDAGDRRCRDEDGRERDERMATSRRRREHGVTARRLEDREDRRHRREPRVLVRRERPDDRGCDRGRQAGHCVEERTPLAALERRRGSEPVGDRLDLGRRMATGQHLERDEGPGMLIGPGVGARAEMLLGRHVPRRADAPALGRAERGWARGLVALALDDVVLLPLRDPEVEELQRAAMADEHVVRLHVAMDETACVRRLERLRHLEEPAELRRERGAVRHRGAEDAPLEELHRDHDDAVRLLDLVDRDDVRMAEGGRGACLAERAPAAIIGELRAQDLQRDGALQHRIVSAEDIRHPASAERSVDPEAEDRPGQDVARHRRRRIGLRRRALRLPRV